MLFGVMKRSRLTIISVLVMFCCLLVAMPALAGQGDGTGGGKDQPLQLATSIPADGAKDVSLSEGIKLTFNKNVVYMTIRDDNKKCFSLFSADGKKIPIEVIMADDQIEFDKRRNVTVKPLQELESGTTYTLKVAPQLEAKSGATLNQEATVTFTTAGTKASSVEKPAAPTAGDKSGSTQERPVATAAAGGKSGSMQERPTATATTGQKASSSGTLDSSQKANPTDSEVTNEATAAQDQDMATEQPVTEAADQLGAVDESTDSTLPMDEEEEGLNQGVIIGVVLILLAAAAYVLYRKKRM